MRKSNVQCPSMPTRTFEVGGLLDHLFNLGCRRAALKSVALFDMALIPPHRCRTDLAQRQLSPMLDIAQRHVLKPFCLA